MNRAGRATPEGPARRAHLDWLRGVAVLIMIAAHTADAWMHPDARAGAIFRAVVLVGGIGAPLFLFLAGVTLSLAASARLHRGSPAEAVLGRSLRHGAMVLGLGFLLQLQSWIVSGGSFARKMLRVEILHVMGLAMMIAAVVWALGRGYRTRALWLAAAATAVAMMTPVVRRSLLILELPEPLQWYLVPVPGRSTFTLFPWAGFLLAGAATGQVLAAAREGLRLHAALLALAAAIGFGGYAASFLPALHADADFWTSSPTFFFVRLGILVASLGAAFAWSRAATLDASPVQDLGLSSLFVYWVHLELVYGRPAAVLRERLDATGYLVAFACFSLALYALVLAKRRWMGPLTARVWRVAFAGSPVHLRAHPWPRRRAAGLVPGDFRENPPESS